MAEINNIKSVNQIELGNSRLTSARDNQTPSSAPTSAAAPRTDTVSLTNTAEQLQSLQQTISEAPIVDNDRVAELKAAIEEGRYFIDADKLAQNLLRSELELR